MHFMTLMLYKVGAQNRIWLVVNEPTQLIVLIATDVSMTTFLVSTLLGSSLRFVKR